MFQKNVTRLCDVNLSCEDGDDGKGGQNLTIKDKNNVRWYKILIIWNGRGK